jgi:hypothetical protein
MAKIKFKVSFVMHVNTPDNPSHREKMEAIDEIRNTILSEKDITDVQVEEFLDNDFTKGCGISSISTYGAKQIGEGD